MSEPYAIWDHYLRRGISTRGCDGLPDTDIVPLVEGLRSAGFTTYQSCQGHPGEGDGTLWIDIGPHKDRWPDSTWFTRIQHVYYGPEGDYWEFWWEPEWASAAMKELSNTYLGDRMTLRMRVDPPKEETT